MLQAVNPLPSTANYFVALGANLPSIHGTPADTLCHALRCIDQCSRKLVDVSDFFRCPSFPAGNGPDYVNAVAEIEGAEEPREMLRALHVIEADFGRERKQRWGQRTLDLDLLAHGDAVLPDAAIQAHWRNLGLEDQMALVPNELILPHPRLQDRAFVLVPWAEIAPSWRHPLLDRTVQEMRGGLDPALLDQIALLSR